MLQTRAVFEWYSVEAGPFSSEGQAMSSVGGILPFNRKVAGSRPAQNGGRIWYILDRAPIIRGLDLQDARLTAGPDGRPQTRFVLSQDAANRFEAYTRSHLLRQSAIVLDNEILSAPVIQEVIRDTGTISGARTAQEADDLAASLRSGALPAAIDILQERTVEASLGADSVHHGMTAALVGLFAVIVAMLIYYRGAGVNATLALLLNALFLVAILACFGAVLTLPGIAAIALTIGMAVDSNVLIFERIREELRSGKTSAVALLAGFRKAFATLVDTHVTTVVSCAFLFFLGTPEVKGFAATLTIGLITNLFTSVFVSRLLFELKPKLNIGLAH
jgi:preprotein translocase subunit SecD